MYQHQLAHALALALGGIVNVCAGLERAAVHPEECQPPHKGVCNYLKGQSRKGLVVRTFELYFPCAVLAGTNWRWHIQRGGQEVHYGVEQGLHALVAVGCAAAYGHQLVCYCLFPYAGDHILWGKVAFIKVLFHHLIVRVGYGVQKLCPVLLRVSAHMLGDLLLAYIHALVVVVHLGLHAHKVDYPDKVRLAAYRQLYGHGVCAEALLHHAYDVEEVRAYYVHLVHIGYAGYVVLGGLMPYRLALGLHAALGAEYRHSAVQHPQ